jgi:hypothetical protein
MFRKAFFPLLLLALLTAAAQGGPAQKQPTPHTPKQGDAERAAIVEALRAPVRKQLKQNVIFQIDHLKVQGDWAFLRGVPQRPAGGALDYKGTPYQTAVDAGAFDDGVVALLRRRKGRWQVVQYVIGATDVPYIGWDKKYRAPSAIFEGDAQQ